MLRLDLVDKLARMKAVDGDLGLDRVVYRQEVAIDREVRAVDALQTLDHLAVVVKEINAVFEAKHELSCGESDRQASRDLVSVENLPAIKQADHVLAEESEHVTERRAMLHMRRGVERERDAVASFDLSKNDAFVLGEIEQRIILGDARPRWAIVAALDLVQDGAVVTVNSPPDSLEIRLDALLAALALLVVRVEQAKHGTVTLYRAKELLARFSRQDLF